jgi:hypothetical protein
MAGLSKYAPGSYGTGQQMHSRQLKPLKENLLGKGSDYIKDLL